LWDWQHRQRAGVVATPSTPQGGRTQELRQQLLLQAAAWDAAAASARQVWKDKDRNVGHSAAQAAGSPANTVVADVTAAAGVGGSELAARQRLVAQSVAALCEGHAAKARVAAHLLAPDVRGMLALKAITKVRHQHAQCTRFCGKCNVAPPSSFALPFLSTKQPNRRVCSYRVYLPHHHMTC
jgi:hypothetical protein